MAKNNSHAFLCASAEDGAWRRARKLIRTIDKACNRLDDDSDTEALHDFRVALRQLRTFVRAYYDYLPISKKYKKALRALARNTNEVRDLEVLVDLLQTEKRLPSLKDNVGIDLLLEKLNCRLLTLYEPLRVVEARRWTLLRKAFSRHIDAVRLKPDSGYSFLEVTRNRIMEQADTLEQELAGLTASHDDHLSHDARITGKRLRYLIEPLRRESSRAADIVAELKIVQDALGDYHDAFVLLQHIESSVYNIFGAYARIRVMQAIEGEEQTPLRDPLGDCLTLVQVIRNQRTNLWERFYKRYVIGRQRLIGDIQSLGAELANPPAAIPSDTAINATVLDIERYRQIP